MPQMNEVQQSSPPRKSPEKNENKPSEAIEAEKEVQNQQQTIPQSQQAQSPQQPQQSQQTKSPQQPQQSQQANSPQQPQSQKPQSHSPQQLQSQKPQSQSPQQPQSQKLQSQELQSQELQAQQSQSQQLQLESPPEQLSPVQVTSEIPNIASNAPQNGIKDSLKSNLITPNHESDVVITATPLSVNKIKSLKESSDEFDELPLSAAVRHMKPTSKHVTIVDDQESSEGIYIYITQPNPQFYFANVRKIYYFKTTIRFRGTKADVDFDHKEDQSKNLLRGL